MNAAIYDITARHKELWVARGMLSDFVLSNRSIVDPVIIALDRNWTLYCLDHATRQAVFVELPAGFDLASVPFSYVPQFDLPHRVILVPFDQLSAIAQNIPAPTDMIFVFSIGRCGSTLLSKIFDKIPGVWSLSEPEGMTSLALDRHKYSTSESVDLLRCAIRLSFRPPAGQESDVFVAKFRSQSSHCIDTYFQAFPNAKNIFVYRDALGWTQSMHRFAQKLGKTLEPAPFEQMRFMWENLSSHTPTDYLENFLDITGDIAPVENILAACWSLNMDHYQRPVASGANLHGFSYDQINNDRAPTVEKLLRVCEFDAKHMECAMTAYEKDSQLGTAATNDSPVVPLTGEQKNTITRLVDRHFSSGQLDGLQGIKGPATNT